METGIGVLFELGRAKVLAKECEHCDFPSARHLDLSPMPGQYIIVRDRVLAPGMETEKPKYPFVLSAGGRK